ncbi:hypothetical protein EJD97_022444 [Solanum chilense]|uniref:Uncharacterized protein n=1 Tax=Solanum chilense TaxID=4083 RepID=A0A6N2AJR2_SOLCI|nr:hypothetical protein EJD97_022444 [Solanum chilense]
MAESHPLVTTVHIKRIPRQKICNFIKLRFSPFQSSKLMKSTLPSNLISDDLPSPRFQALT